MNYHDAEYRYLHDPPFHMFVDQMVRAFEDLLLSPGEMRDAAVYAAYRFEALKGIPPPPAELKP